MGGYLGKDVAKVIRLCRQSVARYVVRFHEGGLDHLLDRRVPFLTKEQQQEIRQLMLTTTPCGGWLWHCFVVEHTPVAIYNISMSHEGIRKLLHRFRLS